MKLTEMSFTATMKLASIAVHAEEGLSGDGHHFDIRTIKSLLSDPEVRAVLDDKANAVFLPLKRKAAGGTNG